MAAKIQTKMLKMWNANKKQNQIISDVFYCFSLLKKQKLSCNYTWWLYKNCNFYVESKKLNKYYI